GLHLLGVADLSPDRARAALRRTGWEEEKTAAKTFGEALAKGSTCVTDDPLALIAADGVDVVVEATGNPEAGITHTLACCTHGKHIVLVTVETDALAGPLLAKRAKQAGIVYSLAYGDQPALICEMVDWARACGFEVVCAGKGTKYLPEYHASTPETVWQYFGFSVEEVARGDFNAKMFNSFVDGTKSAIEMAAVANATGLTAPTNGLAFPPAGADGLAQWLRPREDGGLLDRPGVVEVVSSLDRDGRDVPRDLRWGVFVCFRAGSEYVKDCFRQYGLVTDESGTYAALYRPYHLIGLELGISVASAALRGEPTGAPISFEADVVATAKRDLAPGDLLDGEGGYLVWGKLLPASDSLGRDGLPIGLAHGLRLCRAVAAGKCLTWADVELPEDREAVRIRHEMEALFRPSAD
ncbi:MAG TPA: flagellar biosynthesis protein FlgA, partial [Chloroflexota bacterium]|nr:flagellar biosynthesis protein FlgA [Chloroflexota bacterium]